MANEPDHVVPPATPGQPEAAPLPATAAPPGKIPLVSVVIPCCGQLEYTRLCVPSLLLHSRRPVELIFVDIGSFDGSAEYLDGVAAAAPLRVEVVHCQAETAFQAACLQGLTQAHGEFVVWLNNDTIVTHGWLDQLVALAGVHPAIGVAGPMSNYAPEKQRVSPVPYRLRMPSAGTARGSETAQHIPDLVAMERFAHEWREQQKAQWVEVDRLGGFCLLLKREVLQKVPMFDEKWEAGVFNADAFCWKIRQAGYRLACCRDLFIHHFGSRVASS
jgi:GT2 family glycosyltransferase